MKKISRRSFIRAAGLATVAGAINPLDLAAKERKPSKKKQAIPEINGIYNKEIEYMLSLIQQSIESEYEG
jgi:hypothetical protein